MNQEVKKINGYTIKDEKSRNLILQKTYCFNNLTEVSESEIVKGEIFILKDYDTVFKVVDNETISSLYIKDNLYADVISKSVIIDSLGIDSTNIDTSLFAEIVEYVRNKGIEIVFDHKTYTLNSTITLTSANKLKMSGLGYDSVINYTGNDYAFIINRFQQAQLYNFTINCVNNGGGIYCKHIEQAQTNLLTSTDFNRVYVYNSKSAFKNDCHCGYVRFKECVFEVGTTDGIGIDFRDAYYPEFITIENCAVRTLYRDTENTGIGIIFNSGLMLNISKNDIIGFYNGIEIDASETTESMRTINLLQNSYWDILNKAIYLHSTTSYRFKGVSIKDSTITNSQRSDTLDYAIHIVSCNEIGIDNVSITQECNRVVFLSDCHVGYVKNVFKTGTVTQANNQIGDDVNYEFTNTFKSYTVPANDSINVELGSNYNIVNFKNYMIARRGGNNTTSDLVSTNQSIANGKIIFTLTNNSSSDVNINVKGF